MPVKAKNKTTPKTIVGLFGRQYPADYQYKISSPNELREVRWLIKQGVYKSVKEYEQHTTDIHLKKVKFE
jgi:hypothetical protein